MSKPTRHLNLPAEEVLEYFSYKPETGEVFRTKLRGHSGGHPLGVVGGIHPSGYLYVQILGYKIQLHRLAWLLYYKDWPSNYVDHIDGDKTNNRIGNLRLVDKSQNGMNSLKRKVGSSKYKGVSVKGNSYCAQIRHGGKILHLGSYASEVEAAIAYNKAAKTYFGDYANLNEVSNDSG